MDTRIFFVHLSTYICAYNVCVLYVVPSLFQNNRFDQILNRMKGIEEQLKLLFTSAIAAALSTSQNSASVSLPLINSLTAATSQPAIIHSPVTPAITPSVMPTIMLPVTPTITPAVVQTITPSAVTSTITTNQTPALPGPAVVNVSTAHNVVSISTYVGKYCGVVRTNDPITSMPEIHVSS